MRRLSYGEVITSAVSLGVQLVSGKPLHLREQDRNPKLFESGTI